MNNLFTQSKMGMMLNAALSSAINQSNSEGVQDNNGSIQTNIYQNKNYMRNDNSVYNKLIDIQMTIVKRKLVMNIIMQNNHFFSNIYKYLQIVIALSAPLLNIANLSKYCSSVSNAGNTIYILLSICIIFMIKLKDYVKYDQYYTKAKEQYIKYSLLIQKIERELVKTSTPSIDFLDSINKEISSIELGDPHMSYYDKKIFKRMCDENNIRHGEFNEDIENIFRHKLNSSTPPSSTPPPQLLPITQSPIQLPPVVEQENTSVQEQIEIEKKTYREMMDNMNNKDYQKDIDRLLTRFYKMPNI